MQATKERRHTTIADPNAMYDLSNDYKIPYAFSLILAATLDENPTHQIRTLVLYNYNSLFYDS